MVSWRLPSRNIGITAILALPVNGVALSAYAVSAEVAAIAARRDRFAIADTAI
jgi:hypothetical protein